MKYEELLEKNVKAFEEHVFGNLKPGMPKALLNNIKNAVVSGFKRGFELGYDSGYVKGVDDERHNQEDNGLDA